jgi:hypothetical protein
MSSIYNDATGETLFKRELMWNGLSVRLRKTFVVLENCDQLRSFATGPLA